jgi:zinc protease
MFHSLSAARRLALASLLVLSWPALAQDSADPGPDIGTFTLDNGLQAVVIPDHRAPVVTHMLWYKVGSADEVQGKSGIAHFFEHLMFKGTKDHPAGEFSGEVAAIGGQENAFTSFDYTAYYQQVTPDVLETMMKFEADRMHNLVLSEDVIAPERQVILEERAMRVDSNPQGVLGEELDATLYQNHPYGRPVIGWRHEIAQLSVEDAVAFYRRYYAPNNAVLVVAGDVDLETVRAMAERTYGKVPRGPDLPPRIRPTEPEQETARTVTLRDDRVALPSFQKEWVVPSYRTAKPGEAEALDLLSEILGGGIRSRLYNGLVVESDLAASVGAYYQGTALDSSSFSVSGTPRKPEDLARLEAAVDAQIRKIADEGVTADELADAKARFVRSTIFARDSQTGMARMYGSTLATGGTVEEVAEWPSRIEKVTAEEVKRAAQQFLDLSHATTGYLLTKENGRT